MCDHLLPGSISPPPTSCVPVSFLLQADAPWGKLALGWPSHQPCSVLMMHQSHLPSQIRTTRISASPWPWPELLDVFENYQGMANYKRSFTPDLLTPFSYPKYFMISIQQQYVQIPTKKISQIDVISPLLLLTFFSFFLYEIFLIP